MSIHKRQENGVRGKSYCQLCQQLYFAMLFSHSVSQLLKETKLILGFFLNSLKAQPCLVFFPIPFLMRNDEIFYQHLYCFIEHYPSVYYPFKNFLLQVFPIHRAIQGRMVLRFIPIFGEGCFSFPSQKLLRQDYIFEFGYYKIKIDLLQILMKNTSLLRENGISVLKFSRNGRYCAIATKKNIIVYIFQIKTLQDINSWQLLQQISDHTQTIADIDWSQDEKIITASHDRSVFVWKKKDNRWNKMLVNIDLKLSALTCKWAASCKKFAIGACPNSLILSYYNSESLCWTGIVNYKLTKTPIVSIDFHPSSNIIAVGALDGAIKIVTANLSKSLDINIKKEIIEDYPYEGPFRNISTYWEVLYQIDFLYPNSQVWLNHLSFENNGKNLLVVSHCAHFKLFEVSQNEKFLTNETDISYRGLPFMNGFYDAGKGQIMLGGFDRKVAIFGKSGSNFKFERNLDKNQNSNKFKAKGIVEHYSKGIEKKEWSYGDLPGEDQHLNTIKVQKTHNTVVSYDLNGVVHFWQ